MRIPQFPAMRTYLALLCTVALLLYGCKKDDKPAPVAPSDPTGLIVTNIKKNGFTLSWNAIPGVNYFFLYIATDSAFTHPISGFNPKAVIGNSQTVENLQKATKYYVKLQSFNDGLRSNSLVTSGTTKDVDVFVAGYEYNSALNADMPSYWKNGTVVRLMNPPLSRECMATGVFVVNDDVYVGGYQRGYTFQRTAAYWKSGTYVGLPIDSTTSEGNAIFVSGNDVFVAGREGVFRAVYWKNGTKIGLGSPNKQSIAYSIFVVGSDVYVAGVETNTGSQYYAKLWKNGTLISLTDKPSMAMSVFVAGSDVYVAGQETDSGNGYATYWKNGTAVPLTSGTVNSFASSIFVAGNDVYVAGMEIKNGKTVATVWKNGVATALADGTNNSWAYSVFIESNDVHVAGYEQGASGNIAKYWKNGNANGLTPPTGTGMAMSVFVR